MKKTGEMQEVARKLTGERVTLIWADPESQAAPGVATKAQTGFILSLQTGQDPWACYEELLYQCGSILSGLKHGTDDRGVDYTARTWHDIAMKLAREYLEPGDSDDVKVAMYITLLPNFYKYYDPSKDTLFEQMWSEQGGQ